MLVGGMPCEPPDTHLKHIHLDRFLVEPVSRPLNHAPGFAMEKVYKEIVDI